MPHFITIIKYELTIVKYILALFHTIRRPENWGPESGLLKRTHFMANSNETQPLTSTIGFGWLPLKLYHGERMESETEPR